MWSRDIGIRNVVLGQSSESRAPLPLEQAKQDLLSVGNFKMRIKLGLPWWYSG